MCGIAGIFFLNEIIGIDSSLVNGMTQLLRHRGPDAINLISADSIIFGHTRLSIIDLEGGSQPMWDREQRILITFNGEIYNYLELKEELRSKGHIFVTNSDTEVIIEAFKAWGEDAFGRLNGQFAFALFDKQKKEGFLVRDSFGEKPLYFFSTNSILGFASEVKALVFCKNKLKDDINLSELALSQFLALNYIPGEETLIQGIRKIKPGHFLKIKNGKNNESRYETYPNQNESLLTVSDLSDLFDNSVKIRLRSDVPVGLFLSSGIDSNLALTSAIKFSSKIQCFSANFNERTFNETNKSKKIAEKLGVPIDVIDINLNNLDLPSLIEKLVYHGDEPLADSSSLPVYLLSQATSKKVKVVLSGDGGDELFGGYLTYNATDLHNKMPQSIRSILFMLRWLPNTWSASNNKVSFQEKLDRFIRNLMYPSAAAHFAWNGMFSLNQKLKLLTERLNVSSDKFEETYISLGSSLFTNINKPTLAELLKADQQTYLANDILAKVDRMSMAHGLESRSVFLDPSLLQFSNKFSKKQPNLFKNKKILRDLISTRMDSSLLSSKKQGFSIPVHYWFRTKLKEYIRDFFNSKEVKENGIINQAELLSLLDQHLKYQRNLGFELWGLMVLLLWNQGFVKGRFNLN